MPTIPITTLSDSKVPSSASRKTELGEAPLGSQAIGSEMPLAVYMTVTLALAWILVVALFAFGRTTEAAWLLSVVVMFSIVVVGIPFLLRRTARTRLRAKSRDFDDFLHSDVEVATGKLAGPEAYLQIVTIPLCLALAATVFGSIWLWVS